VPLIILTPVPLTLIGIMIGHWLFGAAFTATSMISRKITVTINKNKNDRKIKKKIN